MKKLLSILLALVLATGLFAACSGSGSGSQAAGSTASGSGAAAAPDGKKTDLLLWLPPFAAGDDGALDKEFWTETLAPWAAENNVDLTIEITPWGNYEEKYLTGFSSGEGPDVGYMYLEMFNDFIEMGALEPLDAYITDADRENYLYLDKGFIKGKQYTMPFIVGNARILYFNMDILEQAGVTELPATWQDLVDVAVKIKEAGLPGVMPFAGEWADPAIGALNNLYYPYLWQAGGDIYNEDGTRVALMDNDAAVKAARFLYDLKFKYGVLPEESMALVGTEVRNQFIEGNIAIASMDAKSGTVLTDAGVNWDFIPSLEDETRATWIASDALIMNSASQNKELAASLIKYITSAEVMAKFHTEIAPFPPITRDEAYNDDERFKEMYEDAEHLHTLPVANGAFKVMDTLYKNLQLMMLGDLSPEEAIQNTVDYAESMGLVSLTQKTVLDLRFDPAEFSFKNYARVFSNFNIGRNLLNSVIVTGGACVLNCIVCAMAAYGFAKKHFPGRDQLFMVYLATLMIPGQVTLIPVFTIIKNLGLMNTHIALMLPILNAFGVFLVRQFMVNVPDELIEAARIDGCGENRLFLSVVVPLVKPVLVSLTIFTFITCWNDFLWPLVTVTDERMQTLTLAIAALKGNYSTNYGLVMAGSTLAFLPPFLLYVALQKEFVEGIALSGIKG